MNRTARLCSFALAVAVLPACQSQWYLQQEYGELVTTEVVVRSNPTGANVALNDVHSGKTALRIPIEYHHQDQLWTRQNSYGTRMREGWSPVFQVIGFPVWGLASLFHFNEEMRRHVYSANKHTLSLTKSKYRDASRVIELDGEEEVVVEFELVPREKAAPAAAPK